MKAEFPVYLINLDRSPDRLQFMQEEAQRVGVEFYRFPAVDGREALPDWLRPQFPEATRLVSGEVGCYASHLCVHQRILHEGLPYAMVLEDDVTLADDLQEVVRAALARTPQGWDYIHLSGRFTRAICSIASLPNGRHLVRHLRIPVNTGGYLISRQGADKMLRPGPRVRPIDRDIKFAWLRGLDVFGIYPSPVSQDTRFHELTMIDCRTHAEPIKKHSWHPGAHISALRGQFYAASKLGISAYLACRWATFWWQIDRSHRSVVPVVMARSRAMVSSDGRS